MNIKKWFAGAFFSFVIKFIFISYYNGYMKILYWVNT